MISELLEALPPEKWLQLRAAFEEDEELHFDVPGTNFWVGVNITTLTPLTREGHYSYGEKHVNS